jgi:ferredoxin-type protein NapF
MAQARSFSRRAFLTGSGSPAARKATISDACLAEAGVSCMACRDACPEEAIRFRPRLGLPFLPEVDLAACTGCGACIEVCPASAIAIAAEAAGPANA